MLIHTRCPIDGTDDSDVVVYPANFDLARIDSRVFSARRLPDRIHYRMVRNSRTGCVRADPILDEDTLLALYGGSDVTYEETAHFTCGTYLDYARQIWPLLGDRRGVLEIGCGHGFFLERMLDRGFAIVEGVEPSADARTKANAGIRDHIREGFLRRGAYAPGTFSLICGFQVLDHVARPNELLQSCLEILTPGGIMYWICHDIGSPAARILGRRCPVVDIEHVVLYDRRTVGMLFEKNGFEVLKIFGVRNRYPLAYWLHLAPLPSPLKRTVGRALAATRLAGVAVKANFGNMGIIARKP